MSFFFFIYPLRKLPCNISKRNRREDVIIHPVNPLSLNTVEEVLAEEERGNTLGALTECFVGEVLNMTLHPQVICPLQNQNPVLYRSRRPCFYMLMLFLALRRVGFNIPFVERIPLIYFVCFSTMRILYSSEMLPYLSSEATYCHTFPVKTCSACFFDNPDFP